MFCVQQVEKGQKMHDLFYELQKKEVEFSSKEMKDLKLSGTSRTFTTYSEKPPGSRIYTTLEGYRCGGMSVKQIECDRGGCVCS